MGGFFTIIAILITVFVLMFGQYNDSTLNFSLMYTELNFQMSFLVFSLILFAMGILSGVLLMLGGLLDTSSRYQKLKKQYEKTSIGATDSDDRVKLLENKIATLEAALKKAMQK